jgi:phosphoenolpyruvate---glycerone phosphotransferase subunit DhaK
VRSATRTLGAAVSSGTSPLTGELMFTLPDDEIYIGMGVHGEHGTSRRKYGPVRDLVDFMLGELLADRPIAKGTPTVALINGSGGTTMMELLTIYGEVNTQLGARGIDLISPMIGSFSTTQEMGGFSISLFTPTPEMLRLWCAPHNAPHFPKIHSQGG